MTSLALTLLVAAAAAAPQVAGAASPLTLDEVVSAVVARSPTIREP